MAYGKYTGFKGWLYKGSTPYYVFALHRLTAMGIILFVGIHVAGFIFNAASIGNLGDNDQYHLRIMVVPNIRRFLRALPHSKWNARCYLGYLAKIT